MKLSKIVDIVFVFDIIPLTNNIDGYIMKKVNIEVLVPESMNWMAIDDQGHVTVFENKPVPETKEDYNFNYWSVDSGGVMYIADVPKPKNWKETLVKI